MFTTLTAAWIELRSETLCPSSPARLVAACCAEIGADDEARAELADGAAVAACALLRAPALVAVAPVLGGVP